MFRYFVSSLSLSLPPPPLSLSSAPPLSLSLSLSLSFSLIAVRTKKYFAHFFFRVLDDEAIKVNNVSSIVPRVPCVDDFTQRRYRRASYTIIIMRHLTTRRENFARGEQDGLI